ncbi:MAG: hypothetical protein J7457_02780 [Roseiflexus sp.]|jgi:TM2 domain-containing membrane protein YozV|nr:hypothetical protein [Roseiflexus sp.]
MNYSPQEQRPVYATQQMPSQTEGAASTALVLEIVFGLFGLLGIGHVYTGRVAVGIAAMVAWWVYIVIAVVVSLLTAGIAGCLFFPISIAVPIISGIQARTYMRQMGGTGSWGSVGMVAGGGCLFVILAVAVFVFALGGLSLMTGN